MLVAEIHLPTIALEKEYTLHKLINEYNALARSKESTDQQINKLIVIILLWTNVLLKILGSDLAGGMKSVYNYKAGGD